MIAGVGVLLIAMGVGVLVGRASSNSTQTAAAPQVITVGSAPSTGASAGAPAEAFTDDWPSGTSGYTVQLQTLPVAGTQTSAVQAAKTAAEGKGAKEVGALKSEDFSSLAVGNYVIYSGVYKKKAEAEKALPALKKNFPGASVVAVSNDSSPSASAKSSPSAPASPSGGGHGSGKGSTSSPAKTNSPNANSGKSYEEKSKNLPDVVETE